MSEDPDGDIDMDEGMALYDDAYWSYFALVARFRWQHFVDWWVSRRYVMPRDVRRR